VRRLEDLNLTMVPQQVEEREPVPTADTEASMLRHISRQPLHIDGFCRQSSLPVATVSSVLAMLELEGLGRRVGPMSHVRAREVSAICGG
jgi:DNA processing protein